MIVFSPHVARFPPPPHVARYGVLAGISITPPRGCLLSGYLPGDKNVRAGPKYVNSDTGIAL